MVVVNWTGGLDAAVAGTGDRPDLSASFSDLVSAQEPLVRRCLRQVLGRHRDEDDLVQEVFLRLAVRLGQPDPIVVVPWLRRVSHNVAVDQVRRRQAIPVEDDQLAALLPTMSAADATTETNDLAAVVRRSISRLPERQRQVLVAQLAAAGTTDIEQAPMDSAARGLLARARAAVRSDLAGSWRAVIAWPLVAGLRRRGSAGTSWVGKAVSFATAAPAAAALSVGAVVATAPMMVGGSGGAPAVPAHVQAATPPATAVRHVAMAVQDLSAAGGTQGSAAGTPTDGTTASATSTSAVVTSGPAVVSPPAGSVMSPAARAWSALTANLVVGALQPPSGAPQPPSGAPYLVPMPAVPGALQGAAAQGAAALRDVVQVATAPISQATSKAVTTGACPVAVLAICSPSTPHP